jgi:diguanylate cyclase (GGDEF)-like protein
VLVASDGAEALEIIQQLESPNLIISDWMMPRMDGLSLCREIRDMEKSEYIYFIILTAKGDKKDIIEGLEAGADDFLTKPFNQEELKYRIRIGERLINLEHRLQESQERLFQIIQGSAVPTLVIDNSHRITHWNTACEKIIGMPASEMIGTHKQWKPFYPEKRPIMADLVVDGTIEEDIVNQYYAGKYKKSSLIEGTYEAIDFFPHMGPDGTWLFFTAAPLIQSSGKIIGAIETLQNITEQKQAEQKNITLNRELKSSNEKLKKIAIYDGLTQIYNRGKIERVIKNLMERYSRHTETKLSLFLFDIDDFKHINDVHGHDVGDEVLKRLSKNIAKQLRQIDYFGRWGGEEFMIALPDTSIHQAIPLITRLINTIGLLEFKKKIKVTVSGGLAECKPGESFDRLIKEIDNKLYDAKRAGKNKFIY